MRENALTRANRMKEHTENETLHEQRNHFIIQKPSVENKLNISRAKHRVSTWQAV